MGRKPVGDRPMTALERQQRRRARLREGRPHPGSLQAFRLEMWRSVEQARPMFPDLSFDEIWHSLDDLGQALRMDDYLKSQGRPSWYLSDYLTCEDTDGPRAPAHPDDRDDNIDAVMMLALKAKGK
jgi:hypothetical protein